eukprot:CAMPEP_0203820254 /NCGR_PEP_ID=MMETSP0115-20131106/39126_1 /ASSEMBLY_ACC=CAM_ASM_000227 /TAXON_ID=33651 /ORGANISM="Bicosoecid sp, Strain ms1" /LENGTH=58 /DNA_ID=CAMNT_0050729261 /DNA_START=191 /DNA_END=364 /DNA_ORIENTATION=+
MATAEDLRAAIADEALRGRRPAGLDVGAAAVLHSWLPAFQHYATEETYRWHRLHALSG